MVQIGEGIKERAEMLESTLWVSELSWEELDILARYFYVSRKEKGATVFREGDRENYMCLIVQGSVQVLKKDVKQREKVMLVIGKGKVFGEMMLFDGEPRSATIISADRTVLLILSRENLESLMKDVPKLASKLLWKLGRMLSQRLRMTSGKLVEFID